jgi:hypothetical protein
MAVRTFPGYVHARMAREGAVGVNILNGVEYLFALNDNMTAQGLVLVAPATVSVDVPAGFAPKALIKAQLQARRDQIAQDTTNALAQLDQQIADSA